VTLGVIIFVSFSIALAVHKPLEKKVVVSAYETYQPNRQFLLDFGLCIAAGLLAWAYNRYAFHIKLKFGLAFFIGYVALGFFIALDMALARERRVIADALKKDSVLPPPNQLYSMTRRFFLVAMGTTLLLLLVITLVISRDMVWLTRAHEDGISAGHALSVVVYELLFIIGVLLIMVVNIVVSYSRNLKLLFTTETGVLERVSRGDLSSLVPVATHDEFGTIAGHTNTMIQGLRHRLQLMSAISVAEEVQQNLLPKAPPVVDGMDIAGTSIYCEQVGGDYYDFLELDGGRLGIVVTDASGHGVGSALHMTTARAFLRFGTRHYEGPARLLQDVNRFLTQDASETGRFTTLFFLELNPPEKRLRWVRAGHDPALFYNAEQNEFETLSGDGMALGVIPDFVFKDSIREGWHAGDIILISTDGISETRNEQGEMFGTDPLKEVVRNHALKPAGTILEAVIDSLTQFRGESPQEDDITLVVMKLL